MPARRSGRGSVPLLEADEVGGPVDGHAHEPRLRHLKGEPADAATRTQSATHRDRSLREHADAGARTERGDRVDERGRVAGGPLDWDLTHPVEDAVQAGLVPQAPLCEGADLAPLSRRDSDGKRIRLGVVVGDQQHRASAGSTTSPSTSSRPQRPTIGTHAAIATR